MTAVIMAASFAFVLTLIGSPFVIASLRRLKAAQPIRGFTSKLINSNGVRPPWAA
jgi:UDP-N-acetylmuramyl pentapeptide phosphotransferase/UDP-N-acetylglucosamine-1-phosphate transferase